MNKFLTCVSFLVLSGCFSPGPKFSVGDCVIENIYREEWEKPHIMKFSKVVKVGKEKYLLSFTAGGPGDRIYYLSSVFSNIDMASVKTTCPKELL